VDLTLKGAFHKRHERREQAVYDNSGQNLLQSLEPSVTTAGVHMACGSERKLVLRYLSLLGKQASRWDLGNAMLNIGVGAKSELGERAYI
jgi:hypothetical protein